MIQALVRVKILNVYFLIFYYASKRAAQKEKKTI